MSLFTPEDLIEYFYNESSPEKAASIKEMLEKDWTLREKFEVIKTTASRLDSIIESPRAEVLFKIINYARKTSKEALS